MIPPPPPPPIPTLPSSPPLPSSRPHPYLAVVPVAILIQDVLSRQADHAAWILAWERLHGDRPVNVHFAQPLGFLVTHCVHTHVTVVVILCRGIEELVLRISVAPTTRNQDLNNSKIQSLSETQSVCKSLFQTQVFSPTKELSFSFLFHLLQTTA